MFAATDSDVAPWYVVETDNKRRTRLGASEQPSILA
jgi:polyphosphate kinase 2 (PPK2 family)